MQDLEQKIKRLEGPLVLETLKNLRLSLEYHWKQQVQDEEIRQTFQGIRADGDVELLRKTIVSEMEDFSAAERWGRCVLLYIASDPELRSHVEEAVDDTLASGAKDLGIGSLIVLGTVLVLLKWRPKKFERKNGDLSVEWEDNDVSAVSDLASLVSS